MKFLWQNLCSLILWDIGKFCMFLSLNGRNFFSTDLWVPTNFLSSFSISGNRKIKNSYYEIIYYGLPYAEPGLKKQSLEKLLSHWLHENSISLVRTLWCFYKIIAYGKTLVTLTTWKSFFPSVYTPMFYKIWSLKKLLLHWSLVDVLLPVCILWCIIRRDLLE